MDEFIQDEVMIHANEDSLYEAIQNINNKFTALFNGLETVYRAVNHSQMISVEEVGNAGNTDI